MSRGMPLAQNAQATDAHHRKKNWIPGCAGMKILWSLCYCMKNYSFSEMVKVAEKVRRGADHAEAFAGRFSIA
jgi:hypothetical protein